MTEAQESGRQNEDRLNGAFRQRAHTLMGELGVLAAGDALNPRLPDDVRGIGRAVLELADALSSMQESFNGFAQWGVVTSEEAGAGRQQGPKDQNLDAKPERFEPVSHFYAGIIDPLAIKNPAAPTDPDKVVEVTIADNFTLAHGDEALQVQGNALYCLNRFASAGGRWLSGPEARSDGFDKYFDVEVRKSALGDSAVFSKALRDLNAAFVELCGREVIERTGTGQASRYRFNTNIILIDRRPSVSEETGEVAAAEGDDDAAYLTGIDATDVDEGPVEPVAYELSQLDIAGAVAQSTEALLAGVEDGPDGKKLDEDPETGDKPEPAESPLKQAEGRLSSVNSAEAIAAHIQVRYPTVRVTPERIVRTANGDTTITSHLVAGMGLMYSQEATKRVIRRIVEGTGQTYIEPDWS